VPTTFAARGWPKNPDCRLPASACINGIDRALVAKHHISLT